jgi:hypothetical protein
MNGLFDSLGRDLRYSLRGLSRRPAFTFAAVVTLAVGIGATTAIFSVVYSVLIKPLPYPNADELVSIRPAAPGANIDDLTSEPTMYLTYRDENRTFADVGLWDRLRSATLTDRGTATRVPALRVTDGTLQALGVQPMRGRWFTEQEQFGPLLADEPRPVILSYAFWQRRFGGDEAVLGRELTMEAFGLAGQWHVVGIMPSGFRFLDTTPQPDVIVSASATCATTKTLRVELRSCVALEPRGKPLKGVADGDAQGGVTKDPRSSGSWRSWGGTSVSRWPTTVRLDPGVRAQLSVKNAFDDGRCATS